MRPLTESLPSSEPWEMAWDVRCPRTRSPSSPEPSELERSFVSLRMLLAVILVAGLFPAK